MKFEYYIYIVKDTEGGVAWCVAEDPSDNVMVSGISNGERKTMESEAYHLPSWCDEHGFTLIERTKVETL